MFGKKRLKMIIAAKTEEIRELKKEKKQLKYLRELEEKKYMKTLEDNNKKQEVFLNIEKSIFRNKY